MIKNFNRPEREKPYYYSSTVENGKVIKHEGDPKYAVYRSEIIEQQRRASIWHKWLESVEQEAYSDFGVVKDNVFYKHYEMNRKIMNGQITEEELFKEKKQ